MTRAELIQNLSRRSGLTHEGARRALDVLFGTATEVGLIAAALRQGERVLLPGFGTFESRLRKERPGLNPQTRARIVIPAGVSPAFRPASGLRAHVRAGGAPGSPGAAAAGPQLGAARGSGLPGDPSPARRGRSWPA